MTIRDEAPECFAALSEMADFRRSMADVDGESVLQQLQDADSTGAASVRQMMEMQERCRKEIDAHPLSKDAQDRFVDRMESYLADPKLMRAKIRLILDRILFPREYPEEWFDDRQFGGGGVLDAAIYLTVLHPKLFEVAQQKWGNHSRVELSTAPAGEAGRTYYNEQVANLEQHGIPGDMSTWAWATEALAVAAKALPFLNLDFRLSDYVEWTCTGEPPNMDAGEEFGEPMLYTQAKFGDRLNEVGGFKRLEAHCKIWKSPDGTFISPLWVYLGWRGQNYGELEVYASNLADIGQGIDAALLLHAPEFDPDDDSRVRLTPTSVFRAGEAMMNLRIKFELEDAVEKGLRADATTKKRAEQGGARSAAARAQRIMSLLNRMEEVVRENPIVVGLGPQRVAELAVDACIEAKPELWSQGRGQIGEYVGEIRRGEAGQELRARLFSMFPQPSLKRPS